MNTDKENRLTDLPDYAVLKKLAAALWKQDNTYQGAAIIVGAGFTRCAAIVDDKNRKPPLWNDLSLTLSQDLAHDLKSDLSPDPLRLAEEYYAYFGKQALHDLIKREVNDTALSPGYLHQSLLDLPWSEVMTTNWDTLLERASRKINHHTYSIVSRQEELSSSRSPRITKLHGTVNVTEDLIFTQEDYRRYPSTNAAFVNFARQTFIENELCLLGFSGDDPNFLQWAGWVRDQLVSNARRIYLVGVFEFSASKRKYLESLNIAPIDLSEAVSEYDDSESRHFEATRLFLETLQNLKPKRAWEWRPTRLNREEPERSKAINRNQTSHYKPAQLKKQLSDLGSDRSSYPGWLICPSILRWDIQSQMRSSYPSIQNIHELEPVDRSKLLYEIAWRHSVTFEPIPLWLAKELLAISNFAESGALLKKHKVEIALLVLKNVAWLDSDESKLIEENAIGLLQEGRKFHSDVNNELEFHRAVSARDNLDFTKLEESVERLSVEDPIWKIKKAFLLGELGYFDEGQTLISEAHQLLFEHHRRDRHSVYVVSRLAWSHWLMRYINIRNQDVEFEPFPSIYHDLKCDPWDHIQYLETKVSDIWAKHKKKTEITPSFEPGRYKNHSDEVSFSNEVHPLILLERTLTSIGFPIRWDNSHFLVKQVSNLVDLEELDNFSRFSLAFRSANSDSDEILTKVFSRARIACLSQEESDQLFENCLSAVEYWKSRVSKELSDRNSYVLDRLQVFIEVLARITVRAMPEQAKKAFLLACELGKSSLCHHRRLSNPLGNLIKFSLKSIENKEHAELLLPALLFPLPSETLLSDTFEWPNPIINSPGGRTENSKMDRRIDDIIESIAPITSKSSFALLRLLPLYEAQFLTPVECQKIGGKIWGESPKFESLPETGLLSYVLLELPVPSYTEARNVVRRHLFEAKESDLLSRERLIDIANASLSKKQVEFPSKDQAKSYFERLVSWRPRDPEMDLLGWDSRKQKETGELIGAALANSIVPSLPDEELNEVAFNKLNTFYNKAESPQATVAFTYFAIANERFVERVESLIRFGLRSTDSRKVAYSSHALLKWREKKSSLSLNGLILMLIYQIGSGRAMGLAAILRTANEMYNKSFLSETEVERLVEILPVIFETSDYNNALRSNREAVSVSLIRAACVKFSRDILTMSKNENKDLRRILEDAKSDALPEVRFT
jgi:hypothetical protein